VRYPLLNVTASRTHAAAAALAAAVAVVGCGRTPSRGPVPVAGAPLDALPCPAPTILKDTLGPYYDGEKTAVPVLVKQPYRAGGPHVPRMPRSESGEPMPGEVVARFIVDTLGRVEPGSVVIQATTSAAHSASVRTALAHAEFTSAEHPRGCKVRARILQPFTFYVETRIGPANTP
jgi:hypothetical protein